MLKLLSCREITERANAYIDGELGPCSRIKFRLHLFICKYCRAFVGQMQTVVSLTQKYGERRSEGEPSQDLMDSFRKRGRGSQQSDAD